MKGWWIRFLLYAYPYRLEFSWVGLLMLLGTALSALAPWPLKLIVDYVLTDRPLPKMATPLSNLPGGDASIALLAWLAATTLVIFAINQLVSIVRAYIQTGAASRMKFDLGADVFQCLQSMSMQFHGRQRTGDLIRRVTADTACVRQLVLQVSVPAISAVVTLIVMFTIMWQIESTIALISLAVGIPMPFLMKRMSPLMMERSYEEQTALSDLMAVAEQTISALPVVKAFDREIEQSRRFEGAAALAIRRHLRAVVSQLYYKFGVSTAMACGTALVMVYGGIQVLGDEISVGDLLVIMSYLAAMYKPIEVLAYLPTMYADTASKALRVLEVLDANQDVREKANAKKLRTHNIDHPNKGMHVAFENVSFGYGPDRPVLKDISLDVQPGKTVALIGPSGAGKSTLVSLIPRFYDPWKGRILVEGTDIRNLTLNSLRDNISIVLQEPFLMPLTIAENIAYGRLSATQQEIESAAAAAYAHEFIQKLPDGYATVIGERGGTLSGGQRQRLAIARALLKDAPILILDEPSSALDAETESKILGAMRHLMVGRTTFIIAHRTSTIRDADVIYEIKEGTLNKRPVDFMEKIYGNNQTQSAWS